jgi:hypothetical protein
MTVYSPMYYRCVTVVLPLTIRAGRPPQYAVFTRFNAVAEALVDRGVTTGPTVSYKRVWHLLQHMFEQVNTE